MRQRAARARGQQGRPRLHLHAHDPGDSGRHAGLLQDRGRALRRGKFSDLQVPLGNSCAVFCLPNRLL